METLKGVNSKDMRKLMEDVALIKNILMSEGELTPWAKKELKRARAEPESSYTSHEELKRRIFSRK